MKTRIASLLLLGTILGLTGVSVHSVKAQSANQNQQLDQSSTVTCTTGAYGQGQVCGVTTEQHAAQNQEIVFRNGSALAAHQVVDTALDTKTTVAATGIMLMGVISAVAFVKTRNS